MPIINNQAMRIQGIGPSMIPGTASDASLEQAVGVSLIADYNEQLAKIGETMQNQLHQKSALRDEIYQLETLKARPETTYNGATGVELTVDEAIKLGVDKTATQKRDSRGIVTGYILNKEVLGETIKTLVENKEQQLAGLNSTSELTMLQVQSLVDQRKNALMMLTNLIATKNETTMGIIRNLKN